MDKLAGVSVETLLRFVMSRVLRNWPTVFGIFSILLHFRHLNSNIEAYIDFFYKRAYATTSI